MKICVTGGLGYIGSHTVLELCKAGHDVVIIDNLSNAHISVHATLEQMTCKTLPFFSHDVRDKEKLEAIFKTHAFDGIIHFAGFKAVGESVKEPLAYYQNNVISTLTLCEVAAAYGVNRFVFSSSATVYGDQKSPLEETAPLLETTNPYGETKAMQERILSDIQHAQPPMMVALLRYFNPVGADPSGLIGEDPKGIPNNLMPFIAQVAAGKRPKLSVFGNDYPTPDGTGVRDYIHVSDLARGHVLALEKLWAGTHAINLGTGRGTSVLELVEAFERVNGVKVPYVIEGRRPGDVAVSFAGVHKAFDVLGFQTKKTIDDMVKDSWRYAQKNVA